MRGVFFVDNSNFLMYFSKQPKIVINSDSYRNMKFSYPNSPQRNRQECTETVSVTSRFDDLRSREIQLHISMTPFEVDVEQLELSFQMLLLELKAVL